MTSERIPTIQGMPEVCYRCGDRDGLDCRAHRMTVYRAWRHLHGCRRILADRRASGLPYMSNTGGRA